MPHVLLIFYFDWFVKKKERRIKDKRYYTSFITYL